VASAAVAYRQQDIGLLTPAFFAYAHFLEDSLHLEEALDVLGTLVRITAGHLPPADAIALALRVGRVNRKLNRFDDAEAEFNVALDAAHDAGEGRGIAMQMRNLAVLSHMRGHTEAACRQLRQSLELCVEIEAHTEALELRVLMGQIGCL